MIILMACNSNKSMSSNNNTQPQVVEKNTTSNTEEKKGKEFYTKKNVEPQAQTNVSSEELQQVMKEAPHPVLTPEQEEMYRKKIEEQLNKKKQTKNKG